MILHESQEVVTTTLRFLKINRMKNITLKSMYVIAYIQSVTAK